MKLDSSQPAKRQLWLLIYNCQADGLGNSLNMLCDEIDVEYYDPIGYRKHENAILERLDSFDRIIIAPSVAPRLGINLDGRINVWELPAFQFSAYHPDLCCLTADGKQLRGPLGGWQSLIAYTAYVGGWDVRRTLAMFCDDVYRELGYFDVWGRARKHFTTRYEQAGFDVSRYIVKWARGGCFMHTPNHPKIHCLRDIAQMVLLRAGLRINDTDLLPMDNLAQGSVFPVYSEVGANLGVRGNYLFKEGGEYRCASLESYVTRSFTAFQGAGDISVAPAVSGLFHRACSIIGRA